MNEQLIPWQKTLTFSPLDRKIYVLFSSPSTGVRTKEFSFDDYPDDGEWEIVQAAYDWLDLQLDNLKENNDN